MTGRWTAQVDDTVGGWIVTTYPHPFSEHDTRPDGDPTRGGRIMAECCCIEDAELLARLLNAAGIPECDRLVPMAHNSDRCGLCGKPVVEHEAVAARASAFQPEISRLGEVGPMV